MRFSLFTDTKKRVSSPVSQHDGEAVSPDMKERVAPQVRKPLSRPGKMTRQDETKVYHACPSVIDFLPWVEYLDEEQCLLLDDGVSVGAVYEVSPAATEGRTAERLEQIRDTVEDALQDSFDEYDSHPWVVQFFCQDENDVDTYVDQLRGYVKPHAEGSSFTEAWLREMERHLKGIARPEGLFRDTLVTGQPWRGQQRRTRMVIYRWIGKNNHDPMPPVAMLNQVCSRVVGALGGAGVRCTRMNGQQVHGWLLRLFNPRPEWVDRDILYRMASRAEPQETPEGTVLCMTIVVQPQDTLEERFTRLSKNAVGENSESLRAREDVATVKKYLGNRHKLYRAGITFLLRAEDMESLKRRRVELTTVLLGAGLQPVRPEFDVGPLNSWLRALPMCFDPDTDKKQWYTRLMWVQHLAGLLPVTGRETGTGHPGFSFFNRGGDVLTFDPLNKLDRTQNAHLLLFGPTGAGKSATLCGSLSQIMAVHRPRLFIAEAGNSFGLLADYFESLGLSVNKISVKPGTGVCLPPFADAHQLVEQGETLQSVDEHSLPDLDEDEGDEEEEKRDILGEMEISARMMITGGDPKEEAALKRADRAMIREALLMATHTTYREGRQMLPVDLQSALWEISRDTQRNDVRRAKAAEMAESLGMFTQPGSFEAELFNREGKLWPEADVTLIDLGHLAREGYEAQMALTMVSMTNMINNIAERDQYLGRDILFVVDEAHIVTVNPLLSPYMTKVVKMWRKLGAWLWLATQNLKDYPDVSEKMLNMAEWWVCLTMPPEEVNNIARFKSLTEEQKAVLLSASKLSGCYTEGVVLAKRTEALFRVVPPSLYLALGMTEKEEKAERRALMKVHQCSELEAAFHVARKLDGLRGLAGRE